MTKRQLIDEIIAINRSASPKFLARFDDRDLDDYLAHLRVLETPRLSGNAEKYERYFLNCPTIRAPQAAWRTDAYHAEEIAADAPEDIDQFDDLDDFDDLPQLEELLDEPHDLAGASVGPAERQQLYAELDELPEEEDEEDPDLEDDVDVEPEAEDPADAHAELEAEEDTVEPVEEGDDETATVEAAEPRGQRLAAAGAVETGPDGGQGFGGAEEDSESWLY